MKQLTTVLALLSVAAFSSAQASPPEPRIFLTNHLGSVNQTLDANGEPEGAYRSYYPYGEMRTGEKTDGQVYGFNGNRTDTKTDLIDYNARHYDAVLGRFVMADTIVPDPADPQSWNRYSYVRNNPVNRVDPSGHADGLYLSSTHISHNTDWNLVERQLAKAGHNLKIQEVSNLDEVAKAIEAYDGSGNTLIMEWHGNREVAGLTSSRSNDAWAAEDFGDALNKNHRFKHVISGGCYHGEMSADGSTFLSRTLRRTRHVENVSGFPTMGASGGGSFSDLNIAIKAGTTNGSVSHGVVVRSSEGILTKGVVNIAKSNLNRLKPALNRVAKAAPGVGLLLVGGAMKARAADGDRFGAVLEAVAAADPGLLGTIMLQSWDRRHEPPEPARGGTPIGPIVAAQ